MEYDLMAESIDFRLKMIQFAKPQIFLYSYLFHSEERIIWKISCEKMENIKEYVTQRGISKEFARIIINDLISMMETVESYMLDVEAVQIRVEDCYLDFENRCLKFIYLPLPKEGNFISRMRKFWDELNYVSIMRDPCWETYFHQMMICLTDPLVTTEKIYSLLVDIQRSYHD